MAKPKSVKALVEDQCAAVRKLAHTLTKRIESGDYNEHDCKIIESCVAMLDAVVDGMTEAVNKGDTKRLLGFWRKSAVVAALVGGLAGLISGVGQGVGTAAFGHFTGDDEVAACVVQITNTTTKYETNIINWDPSAQGIEGSISGGQEPIDWDSPPWTSGPDTVDIESARRTIGKQLFRLRTSNGMELKEASQRTGISESFIRDVEHGDPVAQGLREYIDALQASLEPGRVRVGQADRALFERARQAAELIKQAD